MTNQEAAAAARCSFAAGRQLLVFAYVLSAAVAAVDTDSLLSQRLSDTDCSNAMRTLGASFHWLKPAARGGKRAHSAAAVRD
jgi:hypothetical protein